MAKDTLNLPHHAPAQECLSLLDEPMTSSERWSTFWLAGIFSLRMLGLFMILPIFALYAERLTGNTPTLTGVAIGVYGFSQALLQIPFGFLSDRYGRKRIIALGLAVFAAGSAVAALADSIWGVIWGRALQGSGAISAAVMALAADLTREAHRLKVMAVIGLTIGVSFAVSMILGPLLNAWIGVPGIFWLTGFLALLGIGIVKFQVPDPLVSRIHRDAEPVASQFGRVLCNGELLRVNLGIFALHLLLTATFVAVPLVLRDTGLASDRHWQVYLPALALAMTAMVPFLLFAERRRRLKRVFLGAVTSLIWVEFGLALFPTTAFRITLLLWAFFTAFNLLEALLPSLVAKLAPPDAKGTAMGIYSSSQFLGAFCGGALGGWLNGHWGTVGTFAFAALSAALWGLIAVTVREPAALRNLLFNVGVMDAAQAHLLTLRLHEVPGVVEAAVAEDEGVAYLKVDAYTLDEMQLRQAVFASQQARNDLFLTSHNSFA